MWTEKNSIYVQKLKKCYIQKCGESQFFALEFWNKNYKRELITQFLQFFSVKMLRLKAKSEQKFKNDQLHIISRIF